MDEFLIVIGVGLLIGIPVAIIVLLFWVAGLGRRMRALEARVRKAESRVPEAADQRREATPEMRPQSAATPADATMDGPWQVAADAAKPEGANAQTPKDTPPETPPETPPNPDESTAPENTAPRSFVLRADKAKALGAWLSTNWIYLVAAVSLALAGIFLLQYGIENGLLPPSARVFLALVLGAALVVAGEYFRRRWGDAADDATAFLPSVFSGAGIVVLFAAVLAALHLYALIGPFVALIGLVLVAVLAVVLGWYSGPLLAAVGIVGAFAAPFVVGGKSDTPEMFFAYFALIALVGLGIDAVKRWAWVSVLTLVLAYGAVTYLFATISPQGAEWFLAVLTLLALAAISVPVLSLSPSHKGAGLADCFATGLPRGWPDFPTRLAAGAMLASSGLIALVAQDVPDTLWLAAGLLVVLVAAIAIWARKAEALEDLALMPALALLALAVLPSLEYRGLIQEFHAFLDAEPGTPMPWTPIVLAAIAGGVSILAAWRGLTAARWPFGWAAGAALTGPLMMVALEVYWLPAKVIGAYPWALSAAAMAVLMGGLAGWYARVDGVDKRRVALFVLAALAMIAFALITVLSEVALTLALALTMLAAAILDRRFNMAALSLFVQVGVVVVGWRLVVDPGLIWAAEDGELGHVVLVFVGVIAAEIAAHFLLRPLKRTGALIMLESSAWALAAIFVSVLIFRWLEPVNKLDTHWSVGLLAFVWLVSAANQLWRLQSGGKLMEWVRLGLAGLFGLVGAGLMLVAYGPENPLLSSYEKVLGPVVINSLALAYLAPALVLGFVAWRFRFLPEWARRVFTVLAAAGGAFWLAMVIRHAFHGPVLAAHGTMQGELYSYTIAMLLIGAGLLYQAIAKRSTLLRRVAMAVIALTVVKVFFVDASGLTGLTRVFSFLALGLSLAGLAWLNRWAAGQGEETTDDDG